ncbi:MAG: hypothetical protein EKK48_06645 [Candidatus Melainabacteria bacterium]|nr:MAG: hypothetical protein EKK48_06645 [Candidatus Melainabacteria bacterium]
MSAENTVLQKSKRRTLKPLKRAQRRQSGNMLTMTLLCVGLLLAVCMIGFAFYLLLSEQKRGQTEADKLALEISKSMNENDRIGQINNLVVRNRELVYASRLTANTTVNSNLSFCAPLAQQLLDEASSGSVEIDKERKTQITLQQKRIKDIVERYNMHTQNVATFSLPWWKTYGLQVFQVNGGSLRDVQSNVEHTEIYDDLNIEDRRAKYVQPGSNLYMGNINAKLPTPDNNLDFKITSLPAPVEKLIAPARLANPEIFHFGNLFFDNGKAVVQSFDQIPTAVQVVGRMDVQMREGNQRVQIGSTALTNGAQPIPDAFPDIGNQNQFQLPVKWSNAN